MAENRWTATLNPSVGVPVAGVMMAVIVVAVRLHMPGPFDFQLYWLAARHWADPYNPNLIHTAEAQGLFPTTDLNHIHLPYYYPPPAMLLSWPFSLFPMNATYGLFAGLCGAWLGYLAARRTGWLGLLILFSLPLFYGLAIGQIGLGIACAAITAFELLKKRPRLAGVILAAMVCIKPQSAIVAPFVLWGRWDVVRAGVVTGLLLLLASLVFGPHRWVEWWASMGRFKTEVEPIVPQMMPYLLFDGVWWRALLIAIGVAFAAWERGLAGFLVGTLLCTPYFQLYDLAALSFLGLLIVADWKRLGVLRGLGAGAFGVALIVCPAYPPTMTIFCAGIIAMRLAAGRFAVGRAIEYAPPRLTILAEAR